MDTEEKEIEGYTLERTDIYVTVPLESVYHFIHGDSDTHAHCYETKNFRIVPIDQSPVVEYLRGNKVYYLSQPKLFVVREQTILYLLNEWHEGKLDSKQAIFAVQKDGRYIIHDGIHRTGIMYHMGVKEITLRIIRNWWETVDFTGKYAE